MTCAVEALTLITWLRQYLSGLSVVNSLCFFPSHTVRFGKESLHAAYPWRLRGYAPSRWGWSGCVDYLTSCTGWSLLPCLFISVWTCGHLFYTLGWIQYHLIYCFAQIVPSLAAGSSFLWLLCPFYILPSLWDLDFFFSSFLSTSLLSGSISCSRLTFYVFWPRRSHFSKESWFILLGNGFRNEDLGVRRVLCCWGVVVCSSP